MRLLSMLIFFVGGFIPVFRYTRTVEFTPLFVVASLAFWIPAAFLFSRESALLVRRLLTFIQSSPKFTRFLARRVRPGPIYWITPKSVSLDWEMFAHLYSWFVICLLWVVARALRRDRLSWDYFLDERRHWLLGGIGLAFFVYFPGKSLFLFFLSLGRRARIDLPAA